MLLLLIIFVFWLCRERFSTSPAAFNKTGRKGVATPLVEGRRYLLYHGGWHIWSTNVRRVAFRISVDGIPDRLYLHSPGKIDNLPAALGGLPAQSRYTKLFQSAQPVWLEIIPVETAELEIQSLRRVCAETRDSQSCDLEYTSVV